MKKTIFSSLVLIFGISPAFGAVCTSASAIAVATPIAQAFVQASGDNSPMSVHRITPANGNGITGYTIVFGSLSKFVTVVTASSARTNCEAYNAQMSTK